MSLSRCLIRLLPVFIILAGGAFFTPEARAESQDEIYLRHFNTALDSVSPGHFTFFLNNQAPMDFVPPLFNLTYTVNVFSRPGIPPQITLLEGRVRNYENNQPRELLDFREGQLPETLHPDLIKVSPRRIGFLRNYELYELRFQVSIIPSSGLATRQIQTLDRIKVQVSIPGASPAASPQSGFVDPHARLMLETMAINGPMLDQFPGQVPEPWEGAGRVEEWVERLRRASNQMPPVRVLCAHEGIYQITRRDLEQLGISTERLEPESFRLVEDGNPVAYALSPGDRPGGWDAVVFYSPGVDRFTRPYRAYWLLSETGDAPPALRMAETAWNPEWETRPSRPVQLQRERRYFEFHNYNHLTPTSANHGRWSWLSIPPEEFREALIDVPSAPVGTGHATLTLQVVGSWKVKEYPVVVYWNRRRVHEFTLPPQIVKEESIAIAMETILPGVNRLAIEFPNVVKIKFPTTVDLTDVKLSWPSGLGPADNQAPFERELMPGEASTTSPLLLSLALAGDDAGEVFVVDVADPVAPRRLGVGHVKQSGARAAGPSVAETHPGRHRYWIANRQTARRPWSIAIRNVPPLTDRAQGADYLAITVAELEDETRRLLDHKARQGMRTALVQVETIYDAFGYGAKSSRAIADFLSYAYSHWARPAPYFICLIGETSDYLADAEGIPAGIQRDMVPNFEWGNPKALDRGDHKYTYVSGADWLADLAIGRISVANAEELRHALDKILGYQINPPLGAWRARHLFFTDDEHEFPMLVESVITDTPTTLALPQRLYLSQYPYEPYLRYIERRHSPTATSELMNSLGRGAVTSLYVGHGGPNVMSSERLFHLGDIPRIRKQGPPTFLGSASCDTAWLDYPKAPFEASIGELMVKIPDRGGIGMFGPVSGASSNMHRTLFGFWYQASAGLDLRRLGDIVLYAQNNYYIARNSTFVPDQYVLIGDPGCALPPPASSGLDVQVSTQVLFRNIADRIHLRGQTKAVAYGWAEIALRDRLGRPVVPDQLVRIIKGYFEAAFDIEGQPEPGRLTLRVDAVNRSTGDWETALQFIHVIEPKLELTLTTDPPPSTRFLPGQISRLIKQVHNTLDHRLPRLMVRLMAVGVEKPLSETMIELQPRGMWDESIHGPTPVGINRFKLLVGRQGDRGFTPLGETALTVRAPARSRIAALAMAETGIEAIPHVARQGTDFFVQIENLSIRPANNLTVQLWKKAADMESNTTFTLPVHVPTIAGGSQVTLTLSTPEFFPVSSQVPVLVSVHNDPTAAPSLEFPARVVFERTATVLSRSNIRVVSDSITLSRTRVTREETIFVEADIENTGRTEVKNIRIEAFINQPWERRALAPTVPWIPAMRLHSLLPFQTKRVRLRFDVPATLTGNNTLYVVANTLKEFPEDDWEDNVAGAPFEVVRLPNLSVRADDPPSSPILARPGEPQELYFIVTNTDTTMVTKPCETGVESAAPGRDWENAGKSTPLRAIGPGKSVRTRARWTPKGTETQARITVNSDQYIYEANPDDNQVVYPVLTTAQPQWQDPLPGKTGRHWSLKTLFPNSITENIAPSPDEELVFRTPRNHNFPVLMLEDALSTEGMTHVAPGKKPPQHYWGMDGNILTAGPTDRPPDITFNFTRPHADTSFFDVYLRMPWKPRMSDGKPLGRVLLKINDETEFRLIDSTDQTDWWCHVGRYEITESRFQVTFAKPNHDSHSEVRGLQLLPSVGRLTSPVMAFSADDKPFRVRLEAQTPGKSRMVAVGRWGTLKGNEMQWQEWIILAQQPAAAEAATASVRPQTGYFQLEIRFYSDLTAAPSLRDIVLMEE
jgi:hypothetical protein